MTFLPQQTITYKTYLKTAVTEAFRAVFQHHIDDLLAKTNVTIDFPRKESDYPCLLIRFYEREINNMGVGHIEHIQVDGPDGQPLDSEGGVFDFKHYLYKGDIEYAIYGLSSLDRDLVADSVVQTLGMGSLEEYTNRFFERIYPDERRAEYPDSIWHMININTDLIKPVSENQEATPWLSEDDLIYRGGYRTPVFGEFYSVPPDLPKQYVEKVLQFPYIGGLEEIPKGNVEDESFWQPPILTE